MMSNQEIIDVVQAAEDGKTIERRYQGDRGEDWAVCQRPLWHFNAYDYRVKPELLEFWVNVYKTGPSVGYDSKQHAIDASGEGRLKTIKVREVES